MAAGKYLVLKGINYDGKRAEPGDVVDDIPGESISWLLEDGAIDKVPGSQSKSPGKKAAATRAAKEEGKEIAKLARKAKKQAAGTELPAEEVLETELYEPESEEVE